MKIKRIVSGMIWLSSLALINACEPNALKDSEHAGKQIIPVAITEATKYDTDDPAIWINFSDPEKSLILGTDKNSDGALYVYDLQGKILHDKVIYGLKRPNNVDVEYGFPLGTDTVDIAMVTERETHKVRIFSLPDMKPLDNGGIEVFEGETGKEFRDLMGISIYKHPETFEFFAIVGRKNGPVDGSYLWQYKLVAREESINLQLVRKFGSYSGNKEIESIAVDDHLGYVYYSDEGVGVRKYYADPKKGNEELALFATSGFAQDHEGIAIYPTSEDTGYILVSDQKANYFHVFRREGINTNPHQHDLLCIVAASTHNSDGSEVSAVPILPSFPKGIFVAMSEDKTFHIYNWEDLAKIIEKPTTLSELCK